MEEHINILLTQENEFRVIVENSPYGIIRYNTDCRRIYVNPLIERVSGLPSCDLLGSSPFDEKILSNDFAEVQVNAVRRVINTASAFKVELEYKARDGNIHYGLCRFTPEIGPDGEVKSVICFIYDNTETKNIDNTLRFIARTGWNEKENFFDELTQYLSRLLRVNSVMICISSKRQGFVETVSLFSKGKIQSSVEYAFADTPCENVLGRELYFNNDIRSSYPNYSLAEETDIVSFAGFPLWASDGSTLGHIAIMDNQPFKDEKIIIRLLQLVAPRVEAELERKQYIHLLKESERKYRNLAESIPNNLILYDKNYYPVYMNHTVRTSTNATLAKINNLPLTERIKDGGNDEYERNLKEVLEKGKTVEFEFLVPNLSSNKEVHLVKIVPERSDNGEITGALAIGCDITERKQNSWLIDILSFAINNALDSIFIREVNSYKYIFVNDSACHSLGYSRDELMRMTAFDFDPDIDIDTINKLKETFTLGKSTVIESRHKAKNGRIFPVEIAFSLFRHGNQRFVLTIVRDISERKKNSQKIEMLSYALNNASDGIYIRERSSANFIYVNDSACRSLGYTREELLKLTVFDIDMVFAREEFSKQFLDNRSIKFESYHKSKDGRVFPVELTQVIFTFEDKEFIMSNVRDISERKQVENMLRESEERYHMVFEHSPVSIWEEDFSGVLTIFDELRVQGVNDLNTFLTYTPHFIDKCAQAIKILDVNHAAEKLHKARNKDELFNKITDTFTPESYLTLKQELIDLWNGDTNQVHEAIVRTLDGEKRHVMIYFSILPTKDKQARAIVSLVDITARKQVEQEITKSEYLKTILNRIANGFLISSDDMYGEVLSIILEITKSKYGEFGYIGENSNPIVPCLTKDVCEECKIEGTSVLISNAMKSTSRSEKVITKKQTFVSNGLLHPPTGQVSIVNYIMVPIIHKNDTIGIITVANKETEYSLEDKEILEEVSKFISPILYVRLQKEKQEKIRILAENELRLSEERFSAAFNLNTLSMCIIRIRDKAIIDINETFVRNSGYTREEIIGKTVVDLNFYVNLEDRNKIFQILREKGKVLDYEFRTRRKSGEIRTQVNTTSIINLEGEPHFLATFRDITEKKLLMKKILTTAVETEEKERQRFAQELHDGIGPLLSSVRMLLQWLLMPNSKADTPQTLEKALNIIDEAHQTIKEISFNLSPHVLQNFGLIEALNGYAEKVRESSAISIDINPGNYQYRDIQIETILYRVLSECLSNTLQHANACNIQIIFNDNQDKLTILYSDDGKGFNPENMNNKGLGLLNMKNRLNSINGELWIDSHHAIGTNIVIEYKNSN